MRRSTMIKAGCGVALVFSTGFLCGAIALFALLMRVIPLSEGWRDEDSKEFVMRHLSRRLALEEEQIEEIRPVVHETLDERYRRRRDYLEEDRELVRGALERIAPVLDEEQRRRGEEMFRRWWREKRRKILPDE